jgi:hypothetical protein
MTLKAALLCCLERELRILLADAGEILAEILHIFEQSRGNHHSSSSCASLSSIPLWFSSYREDEMLNRERERERGREREKR